MNVMAKFGFNEKFISLIHQCISTVNFTLLINRSLVLKKNSHQGNSYNRYNNYLNTTQFILIKLFMTSPIGPKTGSSFSGSLT